MLWPPRWIAVTTHGVFWGYEHTPMEAARLFGPRRVTARFLALSPLPPPPPLNDASASGEGRHLVGLRDAIYYARDMAWPQSGQGWLWQPLSFGTRMAVLLD